MGSVGNSNPWAPYDSYRDCSPGICTIYCPQFCYFIFPPPPADDSPDTPFSPLFIAVIAVLAAALLLVSYYTIATRYCRRRTNHASGATEDNRGELVSDQWRIASSGLDDALISTIRVCKYQKGDSLIEGTECAVCLSEFRENDSLRLLPKCSHAFHLPCIDTWLKSHSNCPLCRADVFPVAPDDSNEIQPSDEVVLTVDDDQIQEETREEEDRNFKQFRRSISLGTFPYELQKDERWRGIAGPSVKRSLSTGRLTFTVHGKGNNSLLLTC